MDRLTIFKLVVLAAFISSSYGNNMGPECSNLKFVQVFYKQYYDIYLGDNPFLISLNELGLFVLMMRESTKLCCSTAVLSFILVPQIPGQDDKEVEELVLDSVKADRIKPETDTVKFYYPEFAYKKRLGVYDSQTPFVRFARSPGPALIMPKPGEKKPVFVGEIIVKSWAIMIFLIVFAMVIGILAWVTDHRINPIDFPSPFYIGIFQGFWWSVITMTTVGYGDKTPKGWITRVLAVVWTMTSAVFLSLFTANASSILAISQYEEDYTNTLGKKIACLNSKHFFDVEINFGAQLIGFSSLIQAIVAAQTGKIDRIVFPNYLDYLYLITRPEVSSIREQFVLTNTVDHPFQTGMAMAVDPKNMTVLQDNFLRCLRHELPSQEKKARRNLFSFDLSVIDSSGLDIKDEKKIPLDSAALLTLTYWCFLIIACLMTLGFSWDFYIYWTRVRPHARDAGADQADPEVVEMADMPQSDDGYVDAGNYDNQQCKVPQSKDGHLDVGNSNDPRYKMSIASGSFHPLPHHHHQGVPSRTK